MRMKVPVPNRADRIAVFDSLGQQIAAEKASCQVLSAEAFSFARTEREKEWMEMLLSRVEATPEIFVTFRNPKDWREGWASQVEKMTDGVQLAAPRFPRVTGFRISATTGISTETLFANSGGSLARCMLSSMTKHWRSMEVLFRHLSTRWDCLCSEINKAIGKIRGMDSRRSPRLGHRRHPLIGSESVGEKRP